MKTKLGNRGSTSDTVMQGILAIVVVAVLLMVVVPVMSGINSSMGTVPGYNTTGGTGGSIVTPLYLTQSTTINNTASAMNITSIIPLVLAASTILAALLIGLYAVFFKR